MNAIERKRLHSLDLLKFICACLIVFLHVATPWQNWILPVTRCAVPIFFMISGFFVYSDERDRYEQKIRSQIPKILKIILWASILFAIIPIAKCIRTGDYSVFSIENLKRLVFFNDTQFGFHLWYLFAYLYVLLIAYTFSKWKSTGVLFVLIPALLVGDLALGKYSLIVFGREFDYICSRNFLFVGIPYFFIGALIKKHQTRLSRIYSKYRYLIWGCVIVFLITTYLEKYMLEANGLWHPQMRDHYLSTTFLSSLLFIIFLNLEVNESCITKWGANKSLYMYVLHPLFMIVFPLATGLLGLSSNAFVINIKPVIILLLTILLIYGADLLKRCYERHTRSKQNRQPYN